MAISRKNMRMLENLGKYAALFCTLLGFYWAADERQAKRIEKTINQVIDSRLNKSIEMLDGHDLDITLLKLSAKRTDAFISDNGFRLKYHERFMRDVASYLHNRPPHDFIKPEEIRFEDFKEQNSNP